MGLDTIGISHEKKDAKQKVKAPKKQRKFKKQKAPRPSPLRTVIARLHATVRQLDRAEREDARAHLAGQRRYEAVMRSLKRL